MTIGSLAPARALLYQRALALLLSTIPVFFAIFGIATVGTAQTPPPTQLDIPEANLIHYGDLIDIDVVGSLDGDWRGSVSPEGFLENLLYAPEPVYGLCKSEQAIADEITRQYSKVLKEPKVVVRVLDRSGRAAALLLGAVRSQQRFKLGRPARLSELLAMSGGITDTASGEITIARPADLNCFSNPESGSRVSVVRFSISQLLNGDPEANPAILSGDIITIVEASPIYVIGGVNNPRPISSRDEMTVSRAIASAGGLAKGAAESEVTVYRHDSKEVKTINVDLKKIRAKQQEDVILKPFDIVDVGEKGRGKPKFAPNLNTEIVSRDIFKLPVRIVE